MAFLKIVLFILFFIGVCVLLSGLLRPLLGVQMRKPRRMRKPRQIRGITASRSPLSKAPRPRPSSSKSGSTTFSAEPSQGPLERIATYLKLRHENKKLENFDITISNPKKLAKGASAEIFIAIYLPALREEVIKLIGARQENEKNQLGETTYHSKLYPGKVVYLTLSSAYLKFSEAPKKNLEDQLNTVSFTVAPLENCPRGKQKVLLSITDSETKEQYHSIIFDLTVEDRGFAGIPKPVISFVGSATTGLGAAGTFLLTNLKQIDEVVGWPAGTACVLLSAWFGFNVNVYKKPQETRVYPEAVLAQMTINDKA